MRRVYIVGASRVFRVLASRAKPVIRSMERHAIDNSIAGHAPHFVKQTAIAAFNIDDNAERRSEGLAFTVIETVPFTLGV